MTLSEMADFVCGKARQTDSSSVAKCKTYLRQRYEMIYAEELWKDSVWGFPFTFTPDSATKPESYDATYFFPSIVDRIIGLRRTDASVPIVAPETFYRWTLDEFIRSGSVEKFHLLPRCVTLVPTAYTYHDLGIYGGDVGTAYQIVYIDDDNERQTLSGTFAATNPVATDVRLVERVTKATSVNQGTLTLNSGDVDIAFAAATATEFPQRLPIRLFPTPSAAVELRALVKKKCIPLDQDGASPELRGIDNCLMAFAQADMLQRARQYGKAGVVVQEATALLAQLKRVAVVQEQHDERVTPCIYETSGDIGDVSGKGYW